MLDRFAGGENRFLQNQRAQGRNAAFSRRLTFVVVCHLAEGQGNERCWNGRFTYERCCLAKNAEGHPLPEGDPDCWDPRRFTYHRCCLSPDEELPPLRPPPSPGSSKQWRLACNTAVGGWMVHELVFYTDDACTTRIRYHGRALESGHRQRFYATHAFDRWVGANELSFWYSLPSSKPGDAWLGLELVRPADVRCVGIWHNNLPSLPVLLQRWDHELDLWVDVQAWPAADGGRWAMLSRGDAPKGAADEALANPRPEDARPLPQVELPLVDAAHDKVPQLAVSQVVGPHSPMANTSFPEAPQEDEVLHSVSQQEKASHDNIAHAVRPPAVDQKAATQEIGNVKGLDSSSVLVGHYSQSAVRDTALAEL